MDQGLNLSQNIDTLFNNIEKYTKTEGVIGKPVTHEDKTFIPVVSVSVGCGGGNTATKMPQGNTSANQQMDSSNMAGGALGLGAKISTDAIIVIDKENISMLTLSAAGNATQLLDKIPEMVKEMTNQQQKGKEVADIEVENALNKRALGYSYVEVKTTTSAQGIRTTTEVTKEIATDTTAQMF